MSLLNTTKSSVNACVFMCVLNLQEEDPHCSQTFGYNFYFDLGLAPLQISQIRVRGEFSVWRKGTMSDKSPDKDYFR